MKSQNSEQEYNTAVNLAVGMAKIITRDRVKDHIIPFCLLYEQMIKRKEIEPLSSLPILDKWKYWNEASGNKVRRLFECQALFIWDKIHEEIETNEN